MIGRVNRVLLGLAGLILLAVGGGVLVTGLGVSVPSWWPFDGKGDVLLGKGDRDRWRDEGWWWPTVIAVLAVLALLGLWWLLSQLSRARLSEMLIDSGDGEGAVLRGKALEGALGDETAALDGVADSKVRLAGRRTAPKARIRLRMEPHGAPARVVRELSDQALAHARDSAGLDELPAEVRLKAVKHRAERVI
ncbi:alkaline shock response membrane anchor protein AmaP [Streptomyces sp. NBC_01754]|uniref:alkaline shock response membrane anchor protein AmaP n=1 Tax=Streptomyces sp. NBC_01754 TaxID=2975930 RepID=UPI002DD7BAF5|nr:alkaline shock response membrane anchor protein AmaP [Streptomyces sp. NBC_01754]WSC91793.1 alkaline shock response membrane anchor protein AmaP [Streptomyces sp. NBC_01754]